MAVVGLLFITTSMLSCVVREDNVSVKYALQTKNNSCPIISPAFLMMKQVDK